MVIAVSQEFKDALNVSHTKVSEFTVTVPAGDPVTLECSAATVSSSADSGTRYRASLSVIPQPGVDLYSILSTPGAKYHIRHGIDFGAGHTELVDMGVYEASAGSINIIDGDINISLVDYWVWLERARFIQPLNLDSSMFASRAAIIAAVVNDAFYPTFTYPGGIDIRDTGGQAFDTRVWDRDRVQVIKDIATDGSLDCYFDASGVFVIRKQPIIDPTDIAWTLRTGGAGNIFTADRERPFDRLYNSVVVSPIDEEQTWEVQRTTINDLTNPRNAEYIGFVPYYYSSPTLDSDSSALAAAETILQRVQGTTEIVGITALGAPQLEVGDNITIAHEQTAADPGFTATHIIDSFDYELLTGSQTFKTRSDTLAEVEEV